MRFPKLPTVRCNQRAALDHSQSKNQITMIISFLRPRRYANLFFFNLWWRVFGKGHTFSFYRNTPDKNLLICRAFRDDTVPGLESSSESNHAEEEALTELQFTT